MKFESWHFAGGFYQISCGFRPCQLKSSFFGDSLFPKIGIEIKSLRDLQEAPSRSGGERDETTRGWARGKRGWEQRGETKGVGSAAPS